jgi:hypothetical protein
VAIDFVRRVVAPRPPAMGRKLIYFFSCRSVAADRRVAGRRNSLAGKRLGATAAGTYGAGRRHSVSTNGCRRDLSPALGGPSRPFETAANA